MKNSNQLYATHAALLNKIRITKSFADEVSNVGTFVLLNFEN